jgi:ATP dependent DNA ligase domain
MAKYINYKYIFPPRPKNAIPSDELNFWDNGSLLGQPKLNGSNTTIYTNGEKHVVMNRHGQRLTNFRLTEQEIKSMYRGNGEWLVINGEYMNKSKQDKSRKVFNHKFVIFDILVFDGNYLVGNTFEQRILLLDNLYGTIDSDQEHLYSVSENIYRVKSYTSNFTELYNDLVETDMMEGLVMKRKNAKLELGTTELNNVKSQIKCRKPTKNYKF